jgi:hypothetical protein
MALTQVKTLGIEDDAVTGAKIADDTVAEANMANDAIGLAELKAGTDGQIISYDASGNPVAVGPGSDGQVLTSTGAGSPPAFEDVPAGGATINNATANELVTVASTTTQLDAEANLTFDGNNLTQTTDADGEGIVISTSGNTYNSLTFDANRSSEGVPLGAIFAKWNGNVVGSMQFNAGSDTSNKDDGFFDIRTAQGGTNTERVRIHQGGLVDIKGTSSVQIEDGDLIIGTAGHGISFAATGDSGATGISNMSEVLDDYEEGDWDPTLPDSDSGIGSVAGWYEKIGKLVAVQFGFVVLTNSDSSGAKVAGFPFTNSGYSVLQVNSEANVGQDGLCLHMTYNQAYGHLKNQENDEKTYANFNNCWVWGAGTYMTTS